MVLSVFYHGLIFAVFFIFAPIFLIVHLCVFFFVIWWHVRFKKRTKFYTVNSSRTLYNSNLPLTQSTFHFPSDHFTLDNSNSR